MSAQKLRIFVELCGASRRIESPILGSCGRFPGRSRRPLRRERPDLSFAASFPKGKSHGGSLVAGLESVQPRSPDRPSRPAGDAPCRARGVPPRTADGGRGGGGGGPPPASPPPPT